ncbi:hypothetical protein PHYBLDRAFT_63449 [Phycomyces blakesleeanus NRRL 1555(-)]|uniref:Uncharacterized protein n=1 Tax=Phycomyces blakesleeanus (strain ATCC 8743b / DSM 1359 / FGSC 10004 / NBRC 33097 / NRRL 1555) TaxID=763407 RepID=A0A162WKM5_PHYB8|nr:hypothetical protein PHYBLDRAFT_63449 [Phycomyces blakesleeanus NRRL 1555(-)]OAD68645.1 hypothetical protein PHYBLDRAFT_63449 [Phycomyces blakesleeanus NRRL 1555(-)]|eukprot:XP_018286685.1 hypothetical protein PHYBLDRAFT_63449 [Phycomyces blakesleeanus NRRL 1555(-)]
MAVSSNTSDGCNHYCSFIAIPHFMSLSYVLFHIGILFVQFMHHKLVGPLQLVVRDIASGAKLSDREKSALQQSVLSASINVLVIVAERVGKVGREVKMIQFIGDDGVVTCKNAEQTLSNDFSPRCCRLP